VHGFGKGEFDIEREREFVRERSHKVILHYSYSLHRM
jgi:hypothetical protein